MRKVRRLAIAAAAAAAMFVPMSSAAPAHAVCYYELAEGSQICGDCMDDKLEKILNKLGIEVYCLQ